MLWATPESWLSNSMAKAWFPGAARQVALYLTSLAVSESVVPAGLQLAPPVVLGPPGEPLPDFPPPPQAAATRAIARAAADIMRALIPSLLPSRAPSWAQALPASAGSPRARG